MKRILMILVAACFIFASCEKKPVTEYLFIRYTMPHKTLNGFGTDKDFNIEGIGFNTFPNDSVAISTAQKKLNSLKKTAENMLNESKGKKDISSLAKSEAANTILHEQYAIIKMVYKSATDKDKYKKEIQEAFPNLYEMNKVNEKYEVTAEFLIMPN